MCSRIVAQVLRNEAQFVRFGKRMMYLLGANVLIGSDADFYWR
ncbi:MAG: hypothetical protein OXE94_06240 [Aestuariivita sp.]|nr:hypothetical protein [Aestuariivita sp.]MCY4202536.1 hypothetical protein [Aestuariivita sp.]MCY4289676.1 hypothetical protein [Aestuariivita sp.]MCY4348073.1 hypothetical protein [Aestuariivita sp.]